MNLNDTYFEAGAWFNAGGKNFTANVDNSVLKVSGGDAAGSLTVNGSNNVFNIDNGSRLIVANASVTDTNKIAVDSSSLEIGTLTNKGAVEVTGESTLKIGALNGRIQLADATIKSGSVVGNASAPAGCVDIIGSEVNFEDGVVINSALNANIKDAEGNSIASVINVAEGAEVVWNTKQYNDGTYSGGFNTDSSDTVNVAGTLSISGDNVYLKATTNVAESGVLNINDAGFQNTYGKLTVKGKMNITDTDANGYQNIKLAGNDNPSTTGELDVDGGVLAIDAPSFAFGGGFKAAGWVDATAAEVTIQNGGKITANAVGFRNGVNSVMTLDNGTFELTTAGDFGTVHSTVGVGFDNYGVINAKNGSTLDFGANALTNAGTINVSGSTFSADALTNNGLVQVSGESTLNIASASGETIDFMDGAIIKDSTIGGGVFVAGNVTFRGDNTFAMLYDYGTLTDYYSTTAPMKWTVEAGASLTLTNAARYGLGYGDDVTINGNIAADGASAARATLTDDDANNDVKQSLFMHGLVAQESKGWDCSSSFTVNNAFVTIGSNNSFGNKSGNYGGTYTFNINNSVLNGSRITFYEALSTTAFTFKDSDVEIGTFMTRDKDSVFTLDNTVLLSTAASNGNDEGNYNAAKLNVINGSTLTYSCKMFNEATGVINVDNATFVAPDIVNNNVIYLNNGTL